MNFILQYFYKELKKKDDPVTFESKNKLHILKDWGETVCLSN